MRMAAPGWLFGLCLLQEPLIKGFDIRGVAGRPSPLPYRAPRSPERGRSWTGGHGRAGRCMIGAPPAPIPSKPPVAQRIGRSALTGSPTESSRLELPRQDAGKQGQIVFQAGMVVDVPLPLGHFLLQEGDGVADGFEDALGRRGNSVRHEFFWMRLSCLWPLRCSRSIPSRQP